MIEKTDKSPQLHMFLVSIIEFINKNHELYQLSERINWDEIERDLSEYYCVDNGRPSIPIRKIVGVVLLKRMIDQRFRAHPKRRKKTNVAARKIKVIAGRVVRDLERKLNTEQLERYEKDLSLFYRVLKQTQQDTNKIYSLHEPEVRCIAKGKEAYRKTSKNSHYRPGIQREEEGVESRNPHTW